jgi:hypothetical protein
MNKSFAATGGIEPPTFGISDQAKSEATRLCWTDLEG